MGPFGCGTAATNAASAEEDGDGVTTGAAGGEGGATAVGVPEGLVASLQAGEWSDNSPPRSRLIDRFLARAAKNSPTSV